MENFIKKRFFWEEILEIIPFGVSLRTISEERQRKEGKKNDAEVLQAPEKIEEKKA